MQIKSHARTYRQPLGAIDVPDTCAQRYNTQVKTNEPGTISYELCQGDQDPLKLLVYER